MLINELSKKTGLSTHTIRFYEKSGLIKGKRDENVKSNNYYHYDEETAEKLELVRDAKAVGFTISEIVDLMDAWYSDTMSINDKKNVLLQKLQFIDLRIKELESIKELIKEYIVGVENKEC